MAWQDQRYCFEFPKPSVRRSNFSCRALRVVCEHGSCDEIHHCRTYHGLLELGYRKFGLAARILCERPGFRNVALPVTSWKAISPKHHRSAEHHITIPDLWSSGRNPHNSGAMNPGVPWRAVALRVTSVRLLSPKSLSLTHQLSGP